MTGTHGNVDAELAPVRDVLLRMAHADADAVLAQADRDVAEERAHVDAQATELMEQARAQGAADAAVLADAEHSRVRREKRSIELRARRAAYDALMSAAADAVRAVVATDPDVVAAMTEQARRELGPAAILTPIPDGGLVAEVDGRRVGLPLAALVERAVADLLTAQEAS